MGGIIPAGVLGDYIEITDVRVKHFRQRRYVSSRLSGLTLIRGEKKYEWRLTIVHRTPSEMIEEVIDHKS